MAPCWLAEKQKKEALSSNLKNMLIAQLGLLCATRMPVWPSGQNEFDTPGPYRDTDDGLCTWTALVLLVNNGKQCVTHYAQVLSRSEGQKKAHAERCGKTTGAAARHREGNFQNLDEEVHNVPEIDSSLSCQVLTLELSGSGSSRRRRSVYLHFPHLL